MNKGITILAFSLGAAVGAVASWGILKKKYEMKIQEVTASMEDVFTKRKERLSKQLETQRENDISECADIINKFGYSNEEPIINDKEDEYSEKPYVITPEEFDILDDYTVVSLTYYDDGILTDEFDDVIEDVEETVGYDAFKHFGEYEDDCVYVRNDKRKCDYEILYDTRKYSEVDR